MRKKYYPSRIKDTTEEYTEGFLGLTKKTRDVTGIDKAKEIFLVEDYSKALEELKSMCDFSAEEVKTHDYTDKLNDSEKLKADAIKTQLLYSPFSLDVRVWMAAGSTIRLKYIVESLRLMFNGREYSTEELSDILTIALKSASRYRITSEEYKLKVYQAEAFSRFFEFKRDLTVEDRVELEDTPYLRPESPAIKKTFDDEHERLQLSILQEQIEDLKKNQQSLQELSDQRKEDLDNLLKITQERDEKEQAERDAILEIKREELMKRLLDLGMNQETLDLFQEKGLVDVGDAVSLEEVANMFESSLSAIHDELSLENMDEFDLDIDSIDETQAALNALAAALKTKQNNEQYKDKTDDEIVEIYLDEARDWWKENIHKYEERNDEGLNEMIIALRVGFKFLKNYTLEARENSRAYRWCIWKRDSEGNVIYENGQKVPIREDKKKVKVKRPWAAHLKLHFMKYLNREELINEKKNLNG